MKWYSKIIFMCCLVTRSWPTLRDPTDCSRPGFFVLHCLLEFAQTYVHWVSDTIQPSHLLSLPSPPVLNFFPALLSFPVCQLFISSSDYSGLIFFRIDWFDLDVQGKGNSLLQHHSLKVSILWCSAFFMVQFSYLYMTTGKTIALTIWTFGIKVMSQLFNILSRFVIAFLSVAYQWVNVSL